MMGEMRSRTDRAVCFDKSSDYILKHSFVLQTARHNVILFRSLGLKKGPRFQRRANPTGSRFLQLFLLWIMGGGIFSLIRHSSDLTVCVPS